MERDTTIAIEVPDEPTCAAIRAMLAPTYWCVGVAPARIEAAIRHSTVVVVARDADGRVLGSARALSDTARRAMVFDVIVEEGRRSEGIGRRMMAVLLDHAALADVSAIWLATRDKKAFYERFGFVVLPHAGPRPDGNVEMIRRRG